MGKYLFLVVLCVGACFLVVDARRVYVQKEGLEQRVAARMEQAVRESPESVRDALLADGKELGLALKPDDVSVTVEDTQELTPAQQAMVDSTRFQNRKVRVEVRYTTRLAGLRRRMRVLDTTIQQVSAEVRGGSMPRLNRALEEAQRVPAVPALPE
jgi:hypothetical protein